jgi:hypothetical protein
MSTELGIKYFWQLESFRIFWLDAGHVVHLAKGETPETLSNGYQFVVPAKAGTETSNLFIRSILLGIGFFD